MVYPLNNYKQKTEFKLIEGGRKKKNNYLILGIIVLLGIAIGISNSFDASNKNETVTSSIDWDNPPCSPKELSNDWENVTHPKIIEKKLKTQTFQNIKTKEMIDFHLYNSQGKKQPHWHRYNPFSEKKKVDYYLDKDGNPVGYGSDKSHIYLKCNTLQ